MLRILLNGGNLPTDADGGIAIDLFRKMANPRLPGNQPLPAAVNAIAQWADQTHARDHDSSARIVQHDDL